jgi:hypothetical protein
MPGQIRIDVGVQIDRRVGDQPQRTERGDVLAD